MYHGSIFQLAAAAIGYLVSYTIPSMPVFQKVRQDRKHKKTLQTHLCSNRFTSKTDNMTWCLETCLLHKCAGRVCWYHFCRISVKSRGNSSCLFFMVLLSAPTNSA